MTEIAKTNDQLRLCIPSLPCPHTLVLTQAVQALPSDQLDELFAKTRNFASFTEDNDPWEERDFGRVEIDGEGYFWKFDYYDESLQFFKENGVRVLTLMHASEY